MDRSHASKNPVTLFFGITGLILLAAYVNISPPSTGLHILGFFVLFITTLFLLGKYTISNIRHVIVITCGSTLYLILRLIGLHHPLYGILLILSIVALEYLWKDN